MAIFISMSKKRHKKVHVRGKATQKLSALGDLIWRIKRLKEKVDYIGNHEIDVGWVDESREQQRTMPKGDALAANARRKAKGKRGRGEIVSNFDADFIGPGREAASLATIARTLNYGRAGGVAKDGHEYGAIPARNFVNVLHRKHMKPILSEMKNSVKMSMSKNSAPTTASITLTRLGVLCKGQLQRAMKDSNEYAANAPITVSGGWMANPVNGKPVHIEGKGSSRPLWNKGTLINSVDFEIKSR